MIESGTSHRGQRQPDHGGRTRWRAAAAGAALLATACSLVPAAAAAQTLRGSKPSIEKMYRFAAGQRLAFYRTAESITRAAVAGRLVPLSGNAHYEISTAVGWPWVTPETRRFVEAFAQQYYATCDAPLVLTSATRPLARQPRNAAEKSVHPAGIAIDMRIPPPGPCRDWIRESLVALERRGLIEATEERRPPHFHVAVLTRPGRMTPLPNLAQAPRRTAPAPAAPRVVEVAAGDVDADATARYQVRIGDSLWEIARRHKLSVDDLLSANEGVRKNAALKPGTVLRIPKPEAR